MSAAVFAVMAAGMLACALSVVMARNLLVAATSLIGLLAITAVAYAALGSGFLAGVQVLVYVGGTVILIVFAILLTRADQIEQPGPGRARRVASFIACAALLAVAAAALLPTALPRTAVLASGSAPVAEPVKGLGLQLLSPGANGYVLALELLSALLLSVLIGGITLAGRRQ